MMRDARGGGGVKPRITSRQGTFYPLQDFDMGTKSYSLPPAIEGGDLRLWPWGVSLPNTSQLCRL